MTQRTLVLATRMDAFMGNRVLDSAAMARLPEGPPITSVAAEARRRGYGFSTLDALGRPADDDDLILADLGAPVRLATSLHHRGTPAACYCLESPLIVHDTYHHIDRISDGFPHTFMFPGTETLLSRSRTIFHPTMWPNPSSDLSPGAPWGERELIAVISSNKRVHTWDPSRFTPRHPRQTLRVAISNLRAARWKRTDPWLNDEFYVDRLEAVLEFSSGPGIALFGHGWDRPVPSTGHRYSEAIRRSYRGSMPYDRKSEALGRFRFTLAFENTSFPGYITEKIFDAMFAGSVPVYLGAPDIADHVPPEIFVDARSFEGWNELSAYLQRMDEARGIEMLNAARDFVRSTSFEPFTAERFATELLDSIDEVAGRA